MDDNEGHGDRDLIWGNGGQLWGRSGEAAWQKGRTDVCPVLKFRAGFCWLISMK